MLKSIPTKAPSGAWNAIRKLMNPRAFWIAAALLALCTAAASAEIQDLLDQTFQGQTGYVWLGARRDETGQFAWTDGEAFAFADWTDGEPSITDRDGTPEPCLCAWNLDGQWRWNDQRSDLLSAVPSLTGSIGLVIEYETRQPA